VVGQWCIGLSLQKEFTKHKYKSGKNEPKEDMDGYFKRFFHPKDSCFIKRKNNKEYQKTALEF